MSLVSDSRPPANLTPLLLVVGLDLETNTAFSVVLAGADPNIRDYSGKKAKQYLPTYASTRAHRKRMTSYSDYELSRHCRPTAQTRRGSLIITHLSLDSADFLSSDA